MNVESEKTRSMMDRVCQDWEERAKALALKGTKQSVANVVLFGEHATTNTAKMLWGVFNKVRKAGETPDVPATNTAPASVAVSVAAESAMEALPQFMVQAGALLGFGTAVSFREAYLSGKLQNWISSLLESQRADFFRIIKEENPEEVRKLERAVLAAVALISRDGGRFGFWVESVRSVFGAKPMVQDAETLKEALMLAPRSNLLDVVHGNEQEQEPEMETESDPEIEPDYLSAYGFDD